SICSISKRCGLTWRRASRSARTRLVSIWAGSKMGSGGIRVAPAVMVSANDLGDLLQGGQQHVGSPGGLLELLGGGLQGRLVAGEQGGGHAEAAGGDQVQPNARADVQHLAGTDAARLEELQRPAEEALGGLLAAQLVREDRQAVGEQFAELGAGVLG